MKKRFLSVILILSLLLSVGLVSTASAAMVGGVEIVEHDGGIAIKVTTDGTYTGGGFKTSLFTNAANTALGGAGYQGAGSHLAGSSKCIADIEITGDEEKPDGSEIGVKTYYSSDISGYLTGKTDTIHVYAYQESEGAVDAKHGTVDIVNGAIKTPLAISPVAVSGSWTYGTAITKTKVADISGGVAPYVFNGAVPTFGGLTLTIDGNAVYIAGTPTSVEAANAAFAIAVKDSTSGTAETANTTASLPAIAKAKLSIKANPATANVSVGATKDISGQFSVEGLKGADKATDLTTISYASGTEANATVDTSGVVKGVAVGTSDIKATLALKGTPANYELDDTQKEATVTVTVQAGAANPIKIGGNKEVTYGDADFTQAATDAVGTVTYASNKTGVATVDATGKVHIVGVGEATITATAAGGTANGKTYAAGTATYTVKVLPKALTVDFGTNLENQALKDLIATLKEGILPDDVGKVDPGAIIWTTEGGDPVDGDTVLKKGDSYKYSVTLTGDKAGNYIAEGTLALKSSGGIVIGGSTNYTVTYNAGSHGNFSSDAATTEKVEKNASPKNVPVVHPHDNYRFMGWSLDGKTVVDPTTQKITKNVTFTALYEVCDHMAYMVGRSDTQFAPNGNLTRAEAATILSRLTEGFDENGTYPAAPYSDLNGSAWYVKYINFAASKGIVNGRPDGSFDPDASITRAEFATMIANFAGLTPVNAASASTDVDGHWAAGYITALEQASIVTGYEDGTFRPNRTITRAEAATMVNGAIDRTPDTNLDLAENSYTNPFTDVNAGQWFFAQVMEATVNHVTAHFHTDK